MQILPSSASSRALRAQMTKHPPCWRHPGWRFLQHLLLSKSILNWRFRSITFHLKCSPAPGWWCQLSPQAGLSWSPAFPFPLRPWPSPVDVTFPVSLTCLWLSPQTASHPQRLLLLISFPTKCPLHWYHGTSKPSRYVQIKPKYHRLYLHVNKDPFNLVSTNFSILSNFCGHSVAKLCLTLQPHGLQHTRLPSPSLLLGICSDSSSLSRWCHPTILSSVTPFSFCPQSFPASGSFPVSQLFASGGQSIGASASASVLPGNIQGWFPLGLTGLISLQSTGLSRVFSRATVGKYQFFGSQSFLWSSSHIQFWSNINLHPQAA